VRDLARAKRLPAGARGRWHKGPRFLRLSCPILWPRREGPIGDQPAAAKDYSPRRGGEQRGGARRDGRSYGFQITGQFEP
jgi:hypothetical protein